MDKETYKNAETLERIERLKEHLEADTLFAGRYSNAKGGNLTVMVDGVKLFLEELK